MQGDCLLNARLSCHQPHLTMSRLEEEKYFRVAEVAQIGYDIATGLSFLHSQRIMHRDVKVGIKEVCFLAFTRLELQAENVFVRYNTDGKKIKRVCIADFDTAFLVGAKYAPNKVVGT